MHRYQCKQELKLEMLTEIQNLVFKTAQVTPC